MGEIKTINQYFPQSVPYPGETLAEKLEEMGIDSKEFALLTGILEITINAIIKGDSPITQNISVKLESITKIPANFWMNSQKGYDEYIANKERKD